MAVGIYDEYSREDETARVRIVTLTNEFNVSFRLEVLFVVNWFPFLCFVEFRINLLFQLEFVVDFIAELLL